MSLSSLFRSKQEVEQEAKDYFEQLFPFGDKQRDHIKKAIEILFPQHLDSNLFFAFIVMKEKTIKSFDSEIIEKEMDKIKPKLNETEKAQIQKLLGFDLSLESLASTKEYLTHAEG